MEDDVHLCRDYNLWGFELMSIFLLGFILPARQFRRPTWLMSSMHEEATDWPGRTRHSDPGLMLGDVENLSSSHMANLERNLWSR